MSRRGPLVTGPHAAVPAADQAPTTVRAWLWGAAFHNWGTKLTAFALALLVFVTTRDEVHRTFTIPIVVEQDDERVLLTDVPDTVEVEVRGAWTRVSRLGTKDLGVAKLRLRDARPGPMSLDPAEIVMPDGVILVNVEYDPVDLRFEPYETAELPVVASVVGRVHADHELVSVTVEPPSWSVRAGRSVVEGITELDTATVQVEGATETIVQRVKLLRPSPEIRFLGRGGRPDASTPEVTVTATIREKPRPEPPTPPPAPPTDTDGEASGDADTDGETDGSGQGP